MKQAKNTEGGWMWWVEQWKAKHPDETPDYKELMQRYIKGEPV